MKHGKVSYQVAVRFRLACLAESMRDKIRFLMKEGS